MVLHLCERCKEWGNDRAGGQTGIAFYCDNIEKTYKELKEKGVEFSQDLITEWFGTYTIFKDLDGNEFWLFESPSEKIYTVQNRIKNDARGNLSRSN